MAKPSEEDLKKLRAGSVQSALEGQDTSGLAAVYDLVSGAVPGPEPDKD